MFTLKQVEAFYHIVMTGSFSRAAEQLNTTQSTVSKRIQQLEALSATPLIDRGARGNTTSQTVPLTPRGEQFFEIACEIRRISGAANERLGTVRVPKKIHLGVTNLTAFTWLAPLFQLIQAQDELLEIIIHVETSPGLFERFSKHALDYVIVPSLFKRFQYSSAEVGAVEFNWSASEILNVPDDLKLRSLLDYVILTHDESSGAGLMFSKWLVERELSSVRKRESTNLMTLVGLTVSGIGISYLPSCFESLLAGKKVKTLTSLPALPSVPYVILHRGENGELDDVVVDCAQRCCQFSVPFQTEQSDLMVATGA